MQYLTKIGEARAGQEVNSDPKEALEYKHDLLKLAAEFKMDVFMLCGSLNSQLREDRFSAVTGHNFAQSVREILQIGRDASILLWSDKVDEQMADSIARLMAEAADHAAWGKLDVRISGTTHGEETLTHFALARSRDEKDWAVRIERPHRPFTDDEWKSGAQVPAAIMFRTDDAQKVGRTLLAMFKELFTAVPDRAVEITVPDDIEEVEIPHAAATTC